MNRIFRSLFLLAGISLTLFAQTDRATLRGVVTDPSGLAVPGADITITEIGTNIEARRLATDESGAYEIPALKPGMYRIKVEKTGFRAYQADNMLLDAGQIRRLDLSLQVGATAETITVQGGAALIQTDSGMISGELDKKKFLDRPLVDVYPSPLALMTTMPGIQGNGWNLVMSGISDRNKQTWAMDGVPNDTAGDQNDNPAFFETVQVNQVGAGADSARATNFNMISKRGANDFHASAYYKHENAGLNAREFFTPKRTPYILHEWDVDVSGRIIKDRTFFYAALFHQKIPLGSWVNRNTPSLKMRAGDLSQFTTAVRDPFNSNTPFPNKQIPTSRFNSVSQKAMDLYYPKPNQGGPDTLTNNYGWSFPYNSDLYKGDWPMYRIDHKVTDKNSLYVRWMARKTPYIRPGSGFEWATYTQKRNHQQLVASDTHIFTPTLINTFTFGHQTDLFLYGEDEQGITPKFGADIVASIGLQGVNAKGYKAQGSPVIAIAGLSTLNSSTGAINYLNADNGVDSYIDTMTWSKGKHVMKFGGEFRRYWFFSGSISNDVYGNFNFNANITGVAFGDFLLGVPFTSTRLDPIVNRMSRNNQFGWFFGDTFKVNSKLTIDYGIRWDYYGIARYDDGLMYNFDMASGKVVVAQENLSKINPLYPKTIPIMAGQVVPNASKSNYQPRISAAYRLTANTVLRGGYNQYTDSWDYNSRRPGANPFQLSESYNNVIANNAALFMFPNPFPASLGSASVPSQGVTYLPLDTTNGTIRQINLTAERQVRAIGLRLSYIGMRNTGLNYGTYNMNKPQPSTIPFNQSRRPYNLYNSVGVFGTDGKVHYNALQMEVQKRAGAFVFNSNFTWSKNMYNWANTENPYAITDKWARDGANREKYWVTSLTYALPFGKQQKFLADAPGAVDYILGGWTMQFISSMASPTYFSPSFGGSDPSGTNTSGGLPDRIGAGNISGSRTPTKWFDPAAFAVPTLGKFGNAAPNSLESFPINVQHLSIAKTFRITERFKTTLTGAFSNLLNHTHFSSINSNISNPNPGMFTATRPNYEPEKQSYRQIDLKLRVEW
ncbi:MAG: TonB-dependent receptor [Acidobacteria bacterium]|nr:TonB-dependent receptor [Acidobacteriota bacterium]